MTTERDLLHALARRLAGGGMTTDAPRHVLATHVRYSPTWGRRIADAISIDTWGSGNYALSGYEVKVTRSDWLRELAKPAKAEMWAQHCTYWWLVAPPGVVRDDLPPGWGLLTTRGTQLVRHTPAPRRRDPLPLPPVAFAGFARAVAQTALRGPSRTDDPPTREVLAPDPDPPTVLAPPGGPLYAAGSCPVFDCTKPHAHHHPERHR